MVRPTAEEIDRLRTVAFHVRESLDEHGYLVGQAVDLHPAFAASRRPSSGLARELVIDAARKGASIAGMDADDATGGLDVSSFDNDDRVHRTYRVKKADKAADGTYGMICGLGSSMLTEDPESLFIEERWVLGYTLTADHLVDEIFAAEIVDRRGDGPVHLILGDPIHLFTAPPPLGFTTDHGDDLPGFDDDEEGDQATGAG